MLVRTNIQFKSHKEKRLRTKLKRVSSAISYIKTIQLLDSIEHHEEATIDSQDISDILGTAAYGADGIRGLLTSPYVSGAAFIASFGRFSFGYDQSTLSIINVMD